MSQSQHAVTGERLIPEAQHGQLVHAEHLVRYRLAARLAGSRRVLDIACGEGYGSAMLAAAGATSVVGVDVDARTVELAASRYPDARYACADIGALPFDDGAFELVASFETIEHVREPERALDELARVTAPGGLLVISTPNKRSYLVENEFHEREFTSEEFLDLLADRFPKVQPVLQHNWNTSLILGPEAARDAGGERTHAVELGKVVGIEPGEELYTLALCSSVEPPEVVPLGIAASVDEAHELAQRLRTAEGEVVRWHNAYEKQAAILADLDAQLGAVYASVWWRATAPLQRAVDKARRRLG